MARGGRFATFSNIVSTVRAWARLDVRRRWPSLVVLVLLAAVGSGTVMTAVAGARRGESAMDRLAARTLAADAFITPNDPDWDWAPYRDLPYVEALTLRPIFDTMAFEDETIPPEAVDYPVVDDQFGTTIEKPVILEGRWYDPDQWDEAVVTAKFARDYDKQAGDSVDVVLGGPEQVYLDPLPADQLTGPHLTLRIVGVVRSVWMSDGAGRPGQLLTTPAFVRRYPDDILGLPDAPQSQRAPLNAMVRLTHGADDIDRLITDIERISGRSDVTVLDMVERRGSTEKTTTFEGRALLAFGAAALLAALFLVGQAVARHVYAGTDDLVTGRALGLTEREGVFAAAAGPALAGFAGAVLGGVAAVVASRWMPIGVASDLEPDPGADLDPVVLGIGVGVTVLVIAVVALAAAALALRARRRAPRRRRSRLAARTARLPLPMSLGLRFALEPGQGSARIPVLPALSGAVVGAFGLVAVVVLGAGLDDALQDPARFGQTYDVATVTGLYGRDYVDPGKFRTLLTDLETVRTVTGLRLSSASHGDTSATLFEYPEDAGLEPVVTDGRMPEAADEVLLGRTALDGFGAEVGDRIELTGSTGSHPFTIVGSGLLPTGPNSHADDEGWVTTAGFDALFDRFEFRAWFISLDHPSPTAADDLLDAWIAAHPTLAPPNGPDFTAPDIREAQQTLDHLRVLPRGLGLFLGMLAAGVVGHALVMAVRRRAVELGVARALGMTPGQTRLSILMHATVVAVIGMLFGVPLGVAGGRTVWRVVTGFTAVQYEAPHPAGAVTLAMVWLLAGALSLAVWPAWRAGRARVASILRAE